MSLSNIDNGGGGRRRKPNNCIFPRMYVCCWKIFIGRTTHRITRTKYRHSFVTTHAGRATRFYYAKPRAADFITGFSPSPPLCVPLILPLKRQCRNSKSAGLLITRLRLSILGAVTTHRLNNASTIIHRGRNKYRQLRTRGEITIFSLLACWYRGPLSLCVEMTIREDDIGDANAPFAFYVKRQRGGSSLPNKFPINVTNVKMWKIGVQRQ